MKRANKAYYAEIRKMLIKKYKENNELDLKEFSSRHNVQLLSLRRWLRDERLIEAMSTREEVAKKRLEVNAYYSTKAKQAFRNLRVGQRVVFGSEEGKQEGVVIDKYKYFFLVKLKNIKTTLRYDDRFKIVE